MFKLFSKNKKAPITTTISEDTTFGEGTVTPSNPIPSDALEIAASLHTSGHLPARTEEKSLGFFGRLVKTLKKTRSSLADGLSTLFLGKKQIDAALYQELESLLLRSDIGPATTRAIIDDVTQQASRQALDNASQLYPLLIEHLHRILEPVSKPWEFPSTEAPTVILMIGINGAGKTTSIGKLAKLFQSQGKSVLLAAGDTFRAAAVEQLVTWGERHHIPVVAQPTGSDSASVVFDAIARAKARNVDLILADTAGRLHTHGNLMTELEKVKRVMGKAHPGAPHEVWLVLDATSGQNALNQAVEFHKKLGVTGLIITKLDGTAKGGILFAIANTLKLPIRYIGIGEQAEDLEPFNANDFIRALFDQTKESEC